MRISTALATCLTTAALVLGSAAVPAQAESRTVTDATGDVRTLVFDEDDDEFGGLPPDSASTTSDGDIVSATYLHTRRRMSLSVTYVDLSSTNDVRAWLFRLQGRNGQQRDVEVSTGFSRGLPVEMRRASNGRRVCRGDIKRHVFYAQKRIEVSFPRYCLGAPLAFRVAHAGLRVKFDESSEVVRYFYDDAQRNGGSPDQIVTRFSPWVARG